MLDTYLGEYELAPNFTITVTRDGKQMIAQATGQQAFNIFPKSEMDVRPSTSNGNESTKSPTKAPKESLVVAMAPGESIDLRFVYIIPGRWISYSQYGSKR